MIKAAEFGVPTLVYEPDPRRSLDSTAVRKIFSVVPEYRGLSCLTSHGLLRDFPLFRRNGERPNSRFFRTAACNLIPEIMCLPTTEDFTSAPVDALEKNQYEGLVYSLNVETDHTYIADGIPVGNCIYGFRGSEAKLFANMSEMFPGTKTLYLSCNYRSTPELIDFIRPHAQSKGLAEKFHTPNPSGPVPRVIGFNSSIDEATWVVNQIRGVP